MKRKVSELRQKQKPNLTLQLRPCDMTCSPEPAAVQEWMSSQDLVLNCLSWKGTKLRLDHSQFPRAFSHNPAATLASPLGRQFTYTLAPPFLPDFRQGEHAKTATDKLPAQLVTVFARTQRFFPQSSPLIKSGRVVLWFYGFGDNFYATPENIMKPLWRSLRRNDNSKVDFRWWESLLLGVTSRGRKIYAVAKTKGWKRPWLSPLAESWPKFAKRNRLVFI